MKISKRVWLLFFALVFFQFTKAQTADEVIARHIEAMGGKEKLLTINSLKLEGSMNVMGADVSITTIALNGVGYRTDISIPSIPDGKGTGFQITTPTKGWSYLPWQGQGSPSPSTEEVLKAGQHSLDLQGNLLNYKEKGSIVEMAGKEKVDGADCYKLKLTNKAGAVINIFIDGVTYYRVKTSKIIKGIGEEVLDETFYKDFRKTSDGYIYAFSQTNQRGTITYSSITVNQPVDESIFYYK
jgi:hypothetical protein